jgi:hypothetical protein
MTVNTVTPEVMAAAVRDGELVARLRLTDARGRPLRVQVRPPLVQRFAANRVTSGQTATFFTDPPPQF